jgi:hypothetical protein
VTATPATIRREQRRHGRSSAPRIQGDILEGAHRGPARPLDIDCEPAAEDRIVEVLARLDEPGDPIAGETGDEEIGLMLTALAAI